MPETEVERIVTTSIPEEYAGRRLDQALAALLPEYSRSQIQAWIRGGEVLLDRTPPNQRHKVRGGEQVEIRVPPAPTLRWEAQEIPLDVVYEDQTLLVINKPAGLVVHPAAGNYAGTLLNALLHYAPELGKVARAGIVHRLDKETSGLMVVARTEPARLHLTAQLRDRSLAREYLAVVNGVMVAGGTVEAPIGRHHRERTRMAVSERGKPAVSHYRVKQKYRAHTLVEVRLESGRTHQIRVHMAHLHYPLVGDAVYGGRVLLPKGASERLKGALRGFRRQALHAAGLGLLHPDTGEAMHWRQALPGDMQELIDALAEDTRLHGDGRA